jgi:hypothetical protein
MSITNLSIRLGWSETKTGAIDRGHTSRIPDRHPSAIDMARIAAVLGIPPGELDKAASEVTGSAKSAALSRQALTGAAEILRADAAEPPSVPDAAVLTPELIARGDELFEVLVKDRPDREFLEFLWRGTKNGQPKSLMERMEGVIAWISDHSRREGARETG